MPNPYLVAILITGSRDWTDEGAIRQVLERPYGLPPFLILGDCPTGADAIAGRLSRELRLRSHVLMALWELHGKAAGPIRNKRMVDRLVEFRNDGYECHVFAFPTARSRGTWDCVNKAKDAGFDVEVIRG